MVRVGLSQSTIGLFLAFTVGLALATPVMGTNASHHEGFHHVGDERPKLGVNQSVGSTRGERIEAGGSTATLTTVTGPAFTVPASLKDDVEEYREQTPRDLAPHAFVLGTEDELYVVFTDEQPKKGLATVTGVILRGEVSGESGMTYGVIVAETATYETDGTRTTVDAVASNPQEYQHELVRIQATHRRVTSLFDPDEGSDLTAASSSGVLVEDPVTVRDLFSRGAARSGSLSILSARSASPTTVQSRIKTWLGSPARLYTFDFEVGFWTDSEATVDGIVLTPESEVRKFLAVHSESDIINSNTTRPLLYVVNEQRDPDPYESVQTLKKSSEDGDLISIEASFYGQKISVQETLEETTGCGETRAEIQTPQGPACVDVVVDNLVYAGAAWTSIPDSREDLLFVTGIASHHSDNRSVTLQGRYQIVGEVVSTERFDPSLPDGRILVVYDLERVGDIDFESYGAEVRDRILGRFEQVRSSVRTQIASSESTNDRFEPNDRFTEAVHIEPGTYRDLEIVTDEFDVFAVDLEAGETLSAFAGFEHSTSNLDLAMTYSNYSPYRYSTSFDDNEAIPPAVVPESGTYYIYVFSDSNTSSPYSLTVDVGTAENGVLVDDNKMCSDISNVSYTCPPEAVTSKFTSDDRFAISWVQLGSIASSHRVTWEWYTPSGEKYTSTTITLNEDDRDARGWYAWDSLNLSEAVLNKPGDWQVVVSVDSERAFTETFSIEGEDESGPVASADLNDDGTISTSELNTAIRDWAQGGYTTAELNKIIQAWAAAG